MSLTLFFFIRECYLDFSICNKHNISVCNKQDIFDVETTLTFGLTVVSRVKVQFCFNQSTFPPSCPVLKFSLYTVSVAAGIEYCHRWVYINVSCKPSVSYKSAKVCFWFTWKWNWPGCFHLYLCMLRFPWQNIRWYNAIQHQHWVARAESALFSQINLYWYLIGKLYGQFVHVCLLMNANDY